jgi:hypothetical protein
LANTPFTLASRLPYQVAEMARGLKVIANQQVSPKNGGRNAVAISFGPKKL